MRLFNFLNENEYSFVSSEELLNILNTKCKNNWEHTLKNKRGSIFRRW